MFLSKKDGGDMKNPKMVRSKVETFFISVSVGVLVFLFQNCDNPGFEANSLNQQFYSDVSSNGSSSSQIEAKNSELCGEPQINPNTDSGIYLYLDCETNVLNVIVLAEKSGSSTYIGSISSDGIIQNLITDSFEVNDNVMVSQNEISFNLEVVDNLYDAFSFTAKSVAKMKLELDPSSPQNIFLGTNKVKVISPFEFISDGSEPKDSVVSLCGKPILSKDQDFGAFVWKDCETQIFNVEFLAGGNQQSIEFIGEIHNPSSTLNSL
ncbi:MAG: hypothetical protein KDD40_09045, partial [Bdellovibrionales bacterium]|nr:hypothetical protein [Bdellovibrionales bacterium]